MTSFLFFEFFDAFELDVNVVNFVYYGKTRLGHYQSSTIDPKSRSHAIPQLRYLYY